MRARTSRRRLAAAIVGAGIGVVAAGAPALAAERAYELVTPQGSAPEVRFGGGAATPDGNIVCFNSERTLAGSTPNGIVTADDGFCARRTPSGWETTWVTGPAPRELRGGRGAQVYHLSPDGARVVFASDMGIFPDYPGGPPGTSSGGTLSAFMWEAGDTRWLAPTPEPLVEARASGQPGNFNDREALAVSEDLRHGIFISSLRLVPEDTNSLLDTYEWTPEVIRLVSRDASGQAVGGVPPLGTDQEQVAAEPGTMSRDGSRIFFHHKGPLAGGAPSGVQSVFMREGDQLKNVSPRRGPGPAADVHFVGASDDGEIVFLVSEEQLTNDAKLANDALYRYDVVRDQLSLIATHANGIFFLGVSADGSTVVYRNGAVPFPELLVHRGGVVTSLGMLFLTDTTTAFGAVASLRSDKRALRITADGTTVVFQSAGGIAGTTPGRMQIYRWSVGDRVRRISAASSGAQPRGDAAIGNYSMILPGYPRESILNTIRQRPNVGRVMSDDGKRIFFESAERLVDEDVNGYIDVYEWHDGEVRLVSPGTQNEDAFYHDSSADGSTVFFTTYARLIPQFDRNAVRDLYAARIGGGFPLPTPRSCNGDACQGGIATPPVLGRPRSVTYAGPEDQVERPSPSSRHSLRKISVRQRRALARHGRTALQVRVSAPGWVDAMATARIGGRNVRVARVLRRAGKAAVVRLPLRLSRQARTALRKQRALRLVITVSYSQSETTVRRVVTLRG